jgi:hypothetical protein
LQGAAADYCWIVEVAEMRDVYYVAENSLASSFGEDLFVYRGRVRCGYYQEHAFQIAWIEVALLPRYLFFRGPLLDLWCGFWGYHLDSGFGVQEAFDLAFGYCACAYYQARAIFQLQEEGEEFGWRLADHFGDV